jgi:hypothetical protein
LSDDQLKLIQNNRYNLVRMIDIKCDLLDYMWSRHCISDLQKESINSVDKLLDIMQRKSVKSFEMFLQCLCDANQKHVAEILKGKTGK